MVGHGLTFKNSGLDMDRKVRQSIHLCCTYTTGSGRCQRWTDL